jgi:hypothetical protein
MRNYSLAHSKFGVDARTGLTPQRSRLHRSIPLWFLMLVILLATGVVAQNSPHVAAVAPDTGKVNDDVTITGENLGKDGVAAAYLSDDTTDFKAMIVDQAADKIVMKVPQVKAGRYNVSILVAGKIIISPFRFTVAE